MNLFKYFLLLYCFSFDLIVSAYDFEQDGLYYNLSSTESLELTKGENQYEGKIIIPSVVYFMNKMFYVEKIAAKALNSSKITEVVLPNTITHIGENAFEYSNIQSVVIPGSVTNMGNNCFYQSKIKTITFEASNTTLRFSYKGTGFERGIFEGCSELKNVYIDRNLGYYSDNDTWYKKDEFMAIFTNCPIENVFLGSNATKIGNYFHDCNNLETIIIPNNITSISNYAFLRCTNLRTIEFNAGLKKIGSYAFKSCHNLKKLLLKEGIESLNSYSFEDCSSLETIYLPNTISEIGNSAFLGCKNISKVYTTNKTPHIISTNAFEAMVYLSATLFVPISTKSYYESTVGWNNFSQIIETENFDDTKETHTITLAVSKGGKVIYNDSVFSNYIYSWSVYNNSTISINIIPDNGYRVKSVLINDEDITNNVKNGILEIKNISSDKRIHVNFEKDEILLSIQDAELGCISMVVENGKSYSFVITPSPGWTISSVTFNGNNVTSLLEDNRYTTPSIFDDSNLNIVYIQDESKEIKFVMSESIVKLSVFSGKLTIDNTGKPTNLHVYSTSGSIITSETIDTGITSIDLPTNCIYIVKVGNETFKIAI